MFPDIISLEQFLATGVMGFILCFVRIGAAAMIMPGVGDSFTPQKVRLYIALGLSLVLFPMVSAHLPENLPGGPVLITLIVMEFIIGLFFGTVARILITALDTAGMLISMQSGLGNAQIFNPAFSTQGSIVGAMLSVTGVVLMFAANLHHLLFAGLLESYGMFPVGGVPDPGGMAEVISRTVNQAFKIGVQIAAPFLIVSMMLYIGMGVLTRLMPQVQVFLLAIPVQILLSFLVMSLTVAAIFMFWLHRFEDGMLFFFSI